MARIRPVQDKRRELPRERGRRLPHLDLLAVRNREVLAVGAEGRVRDRRFEGNMVQCGALAEMHEKSSAICTGKYRSLDCQESARRTHTLVDGKKELPVGR
jgi:thymidine kinase